MPLRNSPKGRNPKAQPANNRLLTKEEVALTLGITKRTLDKWVAAGTIPQPSVRMGHKFVRWLESDIIALVQRLAGRPPADQQQSA